MTLRRNIAGMLRGLAAAIDDAPRVTHAEIEARTAAIFAIPRRVNRFADKLHFDGGAETDRLAVAIASRLEADSPGLYADNAPLSDAIFAHRRMGGV